MKRPSKLHRGPGECIGASRALYIDKLGHAALISFCYSAVRRNEGPRFVFQSVNQHQHVSFLRLNKLWFLSSWRNQQAIYLRCL